MGVISTIEDRLLAEVNDELGNTLKETGSLPGGWTEDLLDRALQMSPCVHVSFISARRGVNDGYYDGLFSVYAVTKGPSDKERRRGDPRSIGAYDIVERLLPRFDGLTLHDIGTLKTGERAVDNLFRDAMFDLGGTVLAINLVLPNMNIPRQAPEGLNDFITFHGKWDLKLPEGSGEPEAEDHITGLNQL